MHVIMFKHRYQTECPTSKNQRMRTFYQPLSSAEILLQKKMLKVKSMMSQDNDQEFRE